MLQPQIHPSPGQRLPQAPAHPTSSHPKVSPAVIERHFDAHMARGIGVGLDPAWVGVSFVLENCLWG